MDINATLLVQMLVFAVFVWFTMKFVWPPLSKAMEERQDKIADGLAAAERGRKELELAKNHIAKELQQAKIQAAEIIDKAGKRASQMIEDAKDDAKKEGKHLLKMAQEQIQQEMLRAKDVLRKEVAELAVAGAELILKREIDAKANSQLLDNLIKEV